MRNTLALVLGGGRGTRLQPLTSYRSKPAVPLAAKYRLIDIPLSNCINSGLHHMYVLTQFLSASLHRHIRSTYRFDHFSGGFVEILAAQQTMEEGTDWYQGTADAVRKNLRYLKQPWIEHVLILSGDQLYRMDYGDLLTTHLQSGADVTISALPVDRKQASGLGIMRVEDSGRVKGFLEKPQSDEEIDIVRMDPAWMDARGVESKGRDCLASMGIYLFNRDMLVNALENTDYQDFGREIFPAVVHSRHVQVHLFDGYWEDIGTIRSFYEANLALAQSNPPFELASATAPIYSRARFLPPTRVDQATIKQSLIADGCAIEPGAVIENSVIGLRCHIGRDVTIRNSVLMGSDEYETPDELSKIAQAGRPPMGIGAGSLIDGAIIDKNVRIGRNVHIVNSAGRQDADINDACQIRDGIVVVGKDHSLPDGWKLES
jgi:glucose-1-phosphate adenylyltransferase